MSWLKGDKITAEDFIAIKEKVKNELARRNAEGSVANYATSYTDMPVQKGKIKVSHITEIVEPLSHINDVDYDLNEPITIKSLTTIQTMLNNLATAEKAALTLEATGCKASCTGLCYTSCSGTCRSCGDSCSQNCDTGCNWTCKGSCRNTCSGRCQGSCGTTCQLGCSNNCKGGSVGGCSA